MSQLIRVEIILNQSVEDDLFERLRTHQAAGHYTRIAPAYGKGNSGERQGDHTWPEENLMLIIYCSPEECDRIIQAAREVKRLFPEEGITLFTLPAEHIPL